MTSGAAVSLPLQPQHQPQKQQTVALAAVLNSLHASAVAVAAAAVGSTAAPAGPSLLLPPPTLPVRNAFRLSLQTLYITRHGYRLVQSSAGEPIHLRRTDAHGAWVSSLHILPLAEQLSSLDGVLDAASADTHIELTRAISTVNAATGQPIQCATLVLRDVSSSVGVYRRYALLTTLGQTVLIAFAASGLVAFARGIPAFDQLVQGAEFLPVLETSVIACQAGLSALLGAISTRQSFQIRAALTAPLGRVSFNVPQHWGLAQFDPPPSNAHQPWPTALVPRNSGAHTTAIVLFPPCPAPLRTDDDLLPCLEAFTQAAHASAMLHPSDPPTTAFGDSEPLVVTQHHVLRGEGRAWEFRIYAAALLDGELHVAMFWTKGMGGYGAYKDMFEELVAAAFAPLESDATSVDASAKTSDDVSGSAETVAKLSPALKPRGTISAATAPLFGTTHRTTTLEALFLGAGLSTLRPGPNGKMHNPYLTTTLLLTHAREVHLNYTPPDGALSRFRRGARPADGSYSLDDDGDTITITLDPGQPPLKGKVEDDYTLLFPAAAFGTLAPLTLLSATPPVRARLLGKTYIAVDGAQAGSACLVTFAPDGSSIMWDHPGLGGKSDAAAAAAAWGLDHFTLWVNAGDGAVVRWTAYCTRAEEPDLVIQGVRFRLKHAWEKS
ncbi:hypothetical protein HDU86_000704 [Geranomyces michiganensis]|nr:hypothetical protein HDU86_000704 [Geranomyces michiganensis]